MSLESNKWLFKLNDIDKEIWEYTQKIGYDPEAIELAGDDLIVDENNKAEIEQYQEIIARKKMIEKKLEKALLQE